MGFGHRLLALSLAAASCACTSTVSVQYLTEQRFPPSDYVDVFTEKPKGPPLDPVARLVFQMAYYDEVAARAILETTARGIGAEACIIETVAQHHTAVYAAVEADRMGRPKNGFIDRVVVSAVAVRYPE